MMLSLAGIALCLFASRLPDPHPVDSSLVRTLLAQTGSDSGLPRTTDWSLVGPVGDSAILLADGTEWARISWSQAAWIQRREPIADLQGWSRFRPTSANILAWGEVPSGGEVSTGIENGRGRNSTSLLTWRSGVGYMHRLGRNLSIGGGLGREKVLFSPYLWRLTGDSGLSSGVAANLRGCAPFVCLELLRHPTLVPPESWLQPRLDSLIQLRLAGDFWSYTDTGAYSAAWERRIALRVGVFSYQASWCPRLWNGAYQRIGVWNLPAGVLRFGMGLDWTEDRAASRVQVGFAPMAWTVKTPGSKGLRMEFVPPDVSLAFRRATEFQLSLRTGIRFAEPF
jgi:hypothetical protein